MYLLVKINSIVKFVVWDRVESTHTGTRYRTIKLSKQMMSIAFQKAADQAAPTFFLLTGGKGRICLPIENEKYRRLQEQKNAASISKT